jgi:hypothetical protein
MRNTKAARIIFVFLLVGALVFLAGKVFPQLPLSGSDFTALYAADLAISRGITPYDHAAVAKIQTEELGLSLKGAVVPSLGYFYPPWYAYLTLPLALFSFRDARLIWLCTNLAMVIAANLLLVNAWSKRAEAWTLFVLGASVLFLPVVWTMLGGEFAIPVLLAAAASIWAIEKGHPRISGISLFFLSLKPQIGLFLLLPLAMGIVKLRNWSAVKWAMGTGALVAASTSLVYPTWLPDFFFAMDSYKAWAGTSDPLGRCDTCVGVKPALEAVLGQSLLSNGLYLGFILLCLVVFMRCWVKSQGDPSYTLAVVTGLTAVATPYLRNYDLVILVLPLTYVWLGWRDLKGLTRGITGLILLLVYTIPWLVIFYGNRELNGRSGLLIASLMLLVLFVLGTRSQDVGSHA